MHTVGGSGVECALEDGCPGGLHCLHEAAKRSGPPLLTYCINAAALQIA